MMNEAYYIEKALRRAKVTPNHGGEILLACFREMKERVLEEADQVAAELTAQRDQMQAVLEYVRDRIASDSKLDWTIDDMRKEVSRALGPIIFAAAAVPAEEPASPLSLVKESP